MKYSQFLQFDKLLENNHSDLNTWKKSNVVLVKEAEGDEEKKDPDKLDTKKGNILTKKGRQRSSLNKQAKKLQDQINKNVADKFLKPIKDLKVQTYKKMAEIGKGKQPKDIVAALRMDLQNIQKIQNKQMAEIEKYAQNTIDINTKKINSLIDKKGLKETTVADLQTYWGLLTTQIMMNLLQKIAVEDDNVIAQVIKDQDILKAARQINAALNKSLKQKTQGLEKTVKEKKETIKQNDAKEEAGTETSETEPSKEGKDKTEETK